MVELREDLAASMATFRASMIEFGRWDNVLPSTMFEFGRTVIDNGDGTDHGWAGHQFVMGGSVHGTRFYGDLPPAEVNSQNFAPTGGRQIPTASVEQYAAKLGSWFGLSNNEFDTHNLGFIG